MKLIIAMKEERKEKNLLVITTSSLNIVIDTEPLLSIPYRGGLLSSLISLSALLEHQAYFTVVYAKEGLKNLNEQKQVFPKKGRVCGGRHEEKKWSGLNVSWNEKKMQQKLDEAILALELRLRSPYG